ncbi:DEAD/DEAH box helicase [Pseudobutyrivibrio sp.]
MKVVIDYEKENNCLLIQPVDSNFGRLRGLASYMKVIKGTLESSTLIRIPLEDNDVNNVYVKVKRIFEEEFSCEIESNLSAKKVFSDAEDENRKFLDFSRKARHIRDNDIDKEEFGDFCNCLAKSSFKRALMSYQLLAAYHIAFSQNACNFSVPGSGKTTTVLAAYQYLREINNEDKRVERIVVVGPLSAFIAWKIEYKECFGNEPVVLEIRGGMNRQYIEEQILTSTSNIELVLISYGSVTSYYALIEYYLRNNKCMLVLDEAHRIKKVGEEARSRYVLDLAKYAKSRVVLTGTPAANSYVDLYNLYHFIWPNMNIIGYSVPQLASMTNNANDTRIADLINRISPFFIRVKKSDLGLPDAIFKEPIMVEMSPKQREIYDAIERVVINRWETVGLPQSLRRAAAIRLRQAATNPSLLLKALESEFDDNDDVVDDIEGVDIEIDENLLNTIVNYKQIEIPKKFITVRNLLTEVLNSGEKAIVWCEFIGTCDDLSLYLTDSGISNRLLYGPCPQEERESIIREFLEEQSSFNVIIANPHAVGESISLHTTCHNAIYFEQGFNAGVYMQSKDRIHRVGLKEGTVTTYYFIQSEDSVDHVAYDRVLLKERRMLELIESNEIPLLANNIDYEENSEDDIKAIIKDYYERRRNLS